MRIKVRVPTRKYNTSLANGEDFSLQRVAFFKLINMHLDMFLNKSFARIESECETKVHAHSFRGPAQITYAPMHPECSI